MIELDTILEEWKEDSKLSTNQLDEDSRVTPALHAKYLEYLSLTKLRLKKAEFKQKELLKDKWMYYEGKMSKEETDAKGWKYDPYEGHNITTKASKEKPLLLMVQLLKSMVIKFGLKLKPSKGSALSLTTLPVQI